MAKENVVYFYSGILVSTEKKKKRKKKRNFGSHIHDGNESHYAVLNKPDTERQTAHTLACRRKHSCQTHKRIDQNSGPQRRGRGGWRGWPGTQTHRKGVLVPLCTQVNSLKHDSLWEGNNSQCVQMTSEWGEEKTELTIACWAQTRTHPPGSPNSITDGCQDVSTEANRKLWSYKERTEIKGTGLETHRKRPFPTWLR